MATGTDLTLVKGDSLTVTVEIEGVAAADIDHIYFSVRHLVTAEFTYDEESEKWIMTIPATSTDDAEYKVGKHSYDVTVYFTNETVNTIIYKGLLTIYAKDNIVDVQIMATIKVTVNQANAIAAKITQSTFKVATNQSILIGASADDVMLLTSDQTAAGNKTFSDNVHIEGDLRVDGTVNFINSNQVNIGDNIITLNADIADDATPTEDAGIQVKRGTQATTGIFWRETDDKWKIDTYEIAKDGDTIDGGTFQCGE